VATETVGKAVSVALSGDEIWINDGTYNENSLIPGSGVYIKSINGRDTVTIEDTVNNGAIFNLHNKSDITIEGLTIVNNSTAGGPFTTSSAVHSGMNHTGTACILKDCVIKGAECAISLRQATAMGDMWKYSRIQIENCYIELTNASTGETAIMTKALIWSTGFGNVYFDIRMYDCTVNTPDGKKNIDVSGLPSSGLVHFDIYRCLFNGEVAVDRTHNSSFNNVANNVWDFTGKSTSNNMLYIGQGGGGSGVFNGSIRNNIFYNTLSGTAITFYLYSGGQSSTTVSYNNFYNIGTKIKDSYATPITLNSTNIEENPLFVNVPLDDYHLSVGSPCIDSGDPNDDYGNEPSHNGLRINMGIYGNTDEATTSPQYIQPTPATNHVITDRFGGTPLDERSVGFRVSYPLVGEINWITDFPHGFGNGLDLRSVVITSDGYQATITVPTTYDSLDLSTDPATISLYGYDNLFDPIIWHDGSVVYRWGQILDPSLISFVSLVGGVFTLVVNNFDQYVVQSGPGELILKDRTSGLTDISNERIVSVEITADGSYPEAVLISEIQITQPVFNEPEFVTTMPETYRFETGNEGIRIVYMWSRDYNNNVSSLPYTVAIEYDSILAIPTLELLDRTSGNSDYTNNISVSVDLCCHDAVVWMLSNSDLSPVSEFDSSWTDVEYTTWTLDNINGIRTVWAYIKDYAGNIRSTSTSIILDTTFDVPFTTLYDRTSGRTQATNESIVSIDLCTHDAIAWIVSDSDLGSVGEDDVKWNTTLHSTWQFATNTLTYTITGSTVGTYIITTEIQTVWIYGKDVAGNIQDSTTDILIKRAIEETSEFKLFDRTSGFEQYTNDHVVSVNIDNSEGYKWIVTESPQAYHENDGAWNSLSYPITWELNAPALTTEEKMLYLYVQDIAGNITQTSAVITLDTENPSLSYIAIQDTTSGSFTYVNSRTVSVTLYNPVDADTYQISEDSNFVGESLLLFESNPLFQLTDSDEQKNVYVRVWDKALNFSNTYSYSVTLDRHIFAPVVTASDRTSGDTLYSNDRIISVDISSIEPPDIVAWLLTENSGLNPDELSSAFISQKPVTYIFSSDGIKTLYVWEKDAAGNKERGISNSIEVDTIAGNPVFEILDRNTGNRLYTNERLINIVITNDVDIVGWLASEDVNTQPSISHPDFISYKPSTFLLKDIEGLRTVYVWLKDVAGNVNLDATSQSITLDTAIDTPNIVLKDRVSGSTVECNDEIVSIIITNDDDATYWLTSLSQTTKPDEFDGRFILPKPSTMFLDDGQYRLRTAYVWVKSLSGAVSETVASHTICMQTGVNPWYVDGVNGNDANDGWMAETAFKTFAQAFTAINNFRANYPGLINVVNHEIRVLPDTYNIHSGVHPNGLTPPDNIRIIGLQGNSSTILSIDSGGGYIIPVFKLDGIEGVHIQELTILGRGNYSAVHFGSNTGNVCILENCIVNSPNAAITFFESGKTDYIATIRNCFVEITSTSLTTGYAPISCGTEIAIVAGLTGNEVYNLIIENSIIETPSRQPGMFFTNCKVIAHLERNVFNKGHVYLNAIDADNQTNSIIHNVFYNATNDLNEQLSPRVLLNYYIDNDGGTITNYIAPIIKNNIFEFVWIGSSIGPFGWGIWEHTNNYFADVKYNAFSAHDTASGLTRSYGFKIQGNGSYGPENYELRPYFVDADNYNFHLLVNSECIDAGDLDDAYSNEPQPHGYRINQGLYGNTSEATSSDHAPYVVPTVASNYIVTDKFGVMLYERSVGIKIENPTYGNINWIPEFYYNFGDAQDYSEVSIGGGSTQAIITVPNSGDTNELRTEPATISLYNINGLFDPAIFHDGNLVYRDGQILDNGLIAYFNYNGTDIALEVANFDSYLVENGPGILTLSDRTNGFSHITNEKIVSVEITSSYSMPPAVLISNTQTLQPLASDPRFTSVPVTYELESGINGLQEVFMWTRDISNFVSSFSATYIIEYDSILSQPVLTLYDITSGKTDYTNNIIVSMELCKHDASQWFLSNLDPSPVDEFDVKWNNVFDSTWALLSGDGPKTVWAYIRDIAGNINYTTHSITLDETIIQPQLILKDITSNDIRYTNDVVVSIEVIINEYVDYIFSNTDLGFVSEHDLKWSSTLPATWALSIQTIHPENKTVWIYVRDLGGNIDSSSQSITLDTQIDVPEIILKDRTSGRTELTNNRIVSIDLSMNETVFWIVSNSNLGSVTEYDSKWTSTINSTWMLSIQSINPELKTIWVYARDLAGNINQNTQRITLDTGIDIPGLILKDITNAKIDYTNDRIVSVELSMPVDTVLWFLYNDTDLDPNEFDPNWASTPYVTWLLSTQTINPEDKMVWLYVKDDAGNINKTSTPITLDALIDPPILTLRDRTNAKTDRTNSVIVSANVDSLEAIKWILSNTSIAPTEFDNRWQMSPYVTWGVPAGDGVKTVWSYVQDYAGNMNNSSITILLDTTIATPSLGLRDITSNNTNYTNSRVVSVTFIKPEANQWFLYNDTDINPDEFDPSWATTSYSTWLLSTQTSFPETKTVWGYTQDLAGNINKTSYAIVLDTTIPSPTLVLKDITSGDSSYTNSLTVTVLKTTPEAAQWFLYNDTDVDPDEFHPSWGVLSYPTWTLSSQSFNPESKTVWLYTKDIAGNVGKTSTAIILDTSVSAPTLTLRDRTNARVDITDSIIVSTELVKSGDTQYWIFGNETDINPGEFDSRWTNTPYVTWQLAPQVLNTEMKRVWGYVKDVAGNINKTFTDILLDTEVLLSDFYLMDITSGNTVYTNSRIVSVVTSDRDSINGWLLTETNISKPDFDDTRFIYPKPLIFELSSSEEWKLVYLWIKDTADNVAIGPITHSIYLDEGVLIPMLDMYDRVSYSRDWTNERTISIEICNDADAAAWLLKEDSATPAEFDPRWQVSEPDDHMLSVSTGQKVLYVWTKDIAGNISSLGLSQEITFDNAIPSDPGLIMKDTSNGNTSFTNERVVSTYINYGSPFPSNITNWLLSESASTQPHELDSRWLTAFPQTFLLSPIPPATPKEEKVVYLWIKNAAGSINAGAPGTAIWLDINTAEANLILQDATSGSSSYTNDRVVSVIIFNDPDAVAWIIEETATATKPPVPVEFDPRWEDTIPVTTYLAQSGDGYKYAWLWIKDEAGNVSPIIFNFAYHRIFLKTTLPADPNFLVFDRTDGNRWYTNERIVSVDISNDAEARFYLLSETQSWLPSEFDPNWTTVPHEKPVDFTLSDYDGWHTVFVWVKDIAGNINNDLKAPVYDTIYSSIYPPNEPIVSVYDRTSGSSEASNDRVISIDIINDPDIRGWLVSETATLNPSLYVFDLTKPVTFELSSGDEFKVLYIWVKDIVGNINTGITTVGIDLDTTPPTADFELLDKDKGKLFWDRDGAITNSQVVSVDIDNYSPDAVAWWLSETQTTSPDEFGSGFVFSPTPPITYMFDNATPEIKTVYLWILDDAGNVGDAITFSITYAEFIPPLIQPGYEQYDINGNALDINDETYKLINSGITVLWDIPATIINEQDYRSATIINHKNADNSVYLEIPNINDTQQLATRAATIVVTGLTQLINPTIAHDSVVVYEDNTILDSILQIVEFDNSSILTMVVDHFDSFEVFSGVGDFTLFDRTSGSTQITDERIVSVEIDSNFGPAERWLISETVTQIPVFSSEFTAIKPATFELSAGDGYKLVYCWFSDSTPYVVETPATFLIRLYTVDPLGPSGELRIYDRTTASRDYTNERIISIETLDDANADFWLTDENQSSAPNEFDSRWVDTKPVSFAIHTSGDGEKEVYAWFKTIAGKINAVTISDTIWLDTLAPYNGSVTLYDRTSGSSDYTNEALISIEIVNEQGAPVAWLVSETQVIQPDEFDAFLSFKPVTFLLETTSGEGNRLIYVWTKDIAGNISTSAITNDIYYDPNIPEASDLILRDRTSGSQYYTNRQIVSVEICDKEIDICCWLLHENPATPTEFDPRFSTVKPEIFTLSPGNGLKMVYLWVKDFAGNISPVSSASITLDISAPTLIKATYDPATKRLTLQFNEVVTNVDKSKIKIFKG